MTPPTEHREGDGSWQVVEKATLRVHTSFLMNPAVKSYFWSLKLSCGHETERRVRWKPQTDGFRRRGWAAMHHSPSLDRLPEEPKRARCQPGRWGI